MANDIFDPSEKIFYDPTNWTYGKTPINEENLNKIETALEDILGKKDKSDSGYIPQIITKLKTNTDDIATNTTNITALQSKDEELNKSIEGLKGENLPDDITMSTLYTTCNTLSSTTASNSSNITTLNNNVTKLNENMSSLNKTVEDIEDKVDQIVGGDFSGFITTDDQLIIKCGDSENLY